MRSNLSIGIVLPVVILLSVITQQPSFADDVRVIELNNLGVRALKNSQYNKAIDFFNDALKLDPLYSMAKGNLSIAYNNYALAIARREPYAALKYLHKAWSIDRNNPTTMQNIDGIIKRVLHKDPKSFDHRVELGDRAFAEGDVEGAMFEYDAALKIKHDATIGKRLEDLRKNVLKPQQEDLVEHRHVQEELADPAAGYHGSLISRSAHLCTRAHGLMKKGEFHEALKDFHQSAYIDQYLDRDADLKYSLRCIDSAILKLGKDPLKFEHRIELAEQARANGDMSGAIIEYGAALKIRDEVETHKKLAEAYRLKNEPDKAAAEDAAARFIEGHPNANPPSNQNSNTLK